MNAAFTLVAAGPPRLSTVLGVDVANVDFNEDNLDIAYPIGILQNFNVGQNSQIMRLWEIGSERSYFIRGRTVGQIGLGRIMYHGPSLLRVLYAYLKSTSGAAQFEQLYVNNANAKLNTANADGAKDQFQLPPGYENLWIDLASDVFSQPVGLLIFMRDSNEDTVGAFYLEYGMVTNHGLTTDAGGTVLTENAALLYERVVPIDVKAVSLIRDYNDIASIVSGTVVGSAA
jgi:hypothetical protein